THDYGVRLLEVRGQPLAHPLFLEDAAQIYPFASTSHAARMLTLNLGKHTETGNAAAAAEARAMLDDLYLNEKAPVAYELVARRYDVMQRYRDGRFRDLRTIATYRTSQRQSDSSPR